MIRHLSSTRLLALALFVLSAGCAATAGRATAITDIRTVAGKWTGQIVRTSGSAFSSELTINSAGTYEGHFGAFSSSGSVAIVNGKLKLHQEELSGIGTSGTETIAALEDRNGTPTLVGHGRSVYGPFDFELTRR